VKLRQKQQPHSVIFALKTRPVGTFRKAQPCSPRRQQPQKTPKGDSTSLMTVDELQRGTRALPEIDGRKRKQQKY